MNQYDDDPYYKGFIYAIYLCLSALTGIIIYLIIQGVLQKPFLLP